MFLCSIEHNIYTSIFCFCSLFVVVILGWEFEDPKKKFISLSHSNPDYVLFHLGEYLGAIFFLFFYVHIINE